MTWFPLTEPDEEPGGILEFEEPALELHLYVRDGETFAMWLTERGDLLALRRAADA